MRVEVEAFRGACAGLVIDAQPRTGARVSVYDEIGESLVVSLTTLYALFEDDVRFEVRCDTFDPIHESRIVAASKFLFYRIRLAISNSCFVVE